MATIVLQAAGAFIGGIFGPLGSALGSAAGALAGYSLDRALLTSGQTVEGARLAQMRPFNAEEGAPIVRAYGTVRVGGNLIWATRFTETQRSERQGGKGGGPKTTTYSYTADAAFALCEGPIAGVRRVWADGRELDLDLVTMRVHRGTENQAADPLIAAKQGEGNAPAYRGVAYVVFERFPLADYGNRVPQFQFEVLRPCNELNERVRAVALLPGSTEYGLNPVAVTRMPKPGETEQINRNVLHGPSDLVASLDELQATCPNLEDVAIVVTWFGDDLRAGACTVKPKVMYNDLTGYSEEWRVSGVSRFEAERVSFIDGAAAYGGTPSDHTVVRCIRELKRRGLRVTLYPFVMMDIAPGNALPNPYGGDAQPPFPWRGRITCHPGPDRPGSADKTSTARSQVEHFVGAATSSDVVANGTTVDFIGGEDWGYRRLILHYARLADAAGGVDAFLVGSELRGLTTLRDAADGFPFVETLCDLSASARAILGSSTAITYGADWTEYFGYQPSDGSGDVFFHLDPLWAHPAISAIGIDNYVPLSDWRDTDHAGGNPDGFATPCDRDGLRGQVTAGEGYDWFYLDGAARLARTRSPITDGAYGKDWVFRYKDLKSWWENTHHDRPGGVEAASPTPWVPRSKPFWFTELGCPAVDKGANQPNVFPDPKSSENAAPYFSSGGRSDIAQLRYIEAQLDRWDARSPHYVSGTNPISPVYGGHMVDVSHTWLWAWDARPFPAFPTLGNLWRDGTNWLLGHWLNGRVSGVSVSALIERVLKEHGLVGDATSVEATLAGYLIERPETAREALEPIVRLLGLRVIEEDGMLRFLPADGVPTIDLGAGELVVEEGGIVEERVRLTEDEVPDAAELFFVDPLQDYQSAMARVESDGNGMRTRSLAVPACIEAGAAQAMAEDWLLRQRIGRDTISLTVAPGRLDIGPGVAVRLGSEGATYLIEECEAGLARRLTGRRLRKLPPSPWRTGAARYARPRPQIAGAPLALLMDLPASAARGASGTQMLAVSAKPWRSQVAMASSADSGFQERAAAAGQATVGELRTALPAGYEGRIDPHRHIDVELYGGELASVSNLQLFNGANVAAIRSDSGVWEVVQFGAAEEIAPSVWRLGRLLRGQYGTSDAMAGGAAPGAHFVLLDSSVVASGLPDDLTGLDVNWRVGPAGLPLGGPAFVDITTTGGVRARLPFSPVHLRMRRSSGDAVFSWTRRAREGGDSWLAEDIPLGEERERYRVELRGADGALLRSATVTAASWTYGESQIAADLAGLPRTVDLTVRQISATVGAGVPATRRFTIA